MNRRGFLKFLGAASVGATVAYSFPSIIVPKNIEVVDSINLITKTEIYPKIIEDFWFQESPFMAYMNAMDEELKSALATTDVVIDGKPYGQPTKRISEIFRSFISEI